MTALAGPTLVASPWARVLTGGFLNMTNNVQEALTPSFFYKQLMRHVGRLDLGRVLPCWKPTRMLSGTPSQPGWLEGFFLCCPALESIF